MTPNKNTGLALLVGLLFTLFTLFAILGFAPNLTSEDVRFVVRAMAVIFGTVLLFGAAVASWRVFR